MLWVRWQSSESRVFIALVVLFHLSPPAHCELVDEGGLFEYELVRGEKALGDAVLRIEKGDNGERAIYESAIDVRGRILSFDERTITTSLFVRGLLTTSSIKKWREGALGLLIKRSVDNVSDKSRKISHRNFDDGGQDFQAYVSSRYPIYDYPAGLMYSILAEPERTSLEIILLYGNKFDYFDLRREDDPGQHVVWWHLSDSNGVLDSFCYSQKTESIEEVIKPLRRGEMRLLLRGSEKWRDFKRVETMDSQGGTK